MTLETFASICGALIFICAAVVLYRSRSQPTKERVFALRVLAFGLTVVGISFCIFIYGLLADAQRMTVVGGLGLIASFVILSRVERAAVALGALSK